jgi:hypothetical protein
MPTDDLESAHNTQLTLMLNPWFFAGWAMCAGVTIAFFSAGWLRTLFIGIAVLGVVAFVLLAHSRQRVLVRDGVLYVAGWNRALGSYMSAGVELFRLRTVELISPFFFFQALVCEDSSGEKATIQRLFFRGFRLLTRLVARYALSPPSNVEMSSETQRRLVRVAT